MPKPTLHERIHGVPPPHDSPPGNEPDAPQVRHCWVTAHDEKVPGLLLEWRRTASGWQGRVVHPTLLETGWVVIQEWLPASVLQSVHDEG